MAVWLDAYYDPVSSIHTTPSCIRLADVTGDGDPKLIVADQNRKLRLYRGVNLVSEHVILDTPSAICPFYEEQKGPGTRIPSLAVACGQTIYIYKRLRPHYKFRLPAAPISEEEAEVWKGLNEETLIADMAIEHLSELREKGVALTYQATDLLALEDYPDERDAFLADVRGKIPELSTTITCMECMKKTGDEETATSFLVVGTEHRQLVILDAAGFAILVKVTLPAVPVFIGVTGTLDVEYRIIVACRNGAIHVVKQGQVLGTSMELEAQPCAMTIAGKAVVVACMQNTLHSFTLKGNKNYAILQPAAVQTLETMVSEKMGSVPLHLAALADGSIRMYRDKDMISQLAPPGSGVCVAMRFGKYAREDSTLILSYKSGAMAIKILSRNSSLSKATVQSGPPPEQDIPLNVPKKTRLYVEQTQRERDNAADMHRVFQRDLCRLRLSTARSYVRVLTDTKGAVAFTNAGAVRLSAEVRGLGPEYRIAVALSNTAQGQKPAEQHLLLVKFNPALYAVAHPVVPVPALLPGPVHKLEVRVRCIDRDGGAEPVQLCLCTRSSAVPALAALIDMPLCDPLDD